MYDSRELRIERRKEKKGKKDVKVPSLYPTQIFLQDIAVFIGF